MYYTTGSDRSFYGNLFLETDAIKYPVGQLPLMKMRLTSVIGRNNSSDCTCQEPDVEEEEELEVKNRYEVAPNLEPVIKIKLVKTTKLERTIFQLYMSCESLRLRRGIIDVGDNRVTKNVMDLFGPKDENREQVSIYVSNYDKIPDYMKMSKRFIVLNKECYQAVDMTTYVGREGYYAVAYGVDIDKRFGVEMVVKDHLMFNLQPEDVYRVNNKRECQMLYQLAISGISVRVSRDGHYARNCKYPNLVDLPSTVGFVSKEISPELPRFIEMRTGIMRKCYMRVNDCRDTINILEGSIILRRDGDSVPGIRVANNKNRTVYYVTRSFNFTRREAGVVRKIQVNCYRHALLTISKYREYFDTGQFKLLKNFLVADVFTDNKNQGKGKDKM
jgi:hypothetical protein